MDPASSGSDPAVLAALQRPGNLVFPSNQAYSADFHARGGRVIRQKTGHLIFYTPEGRRFLAVEPGGVALHECEWRRDGDRVRLQRARVHLESDGWVGIRPKGLLNQTVLDLRTRPGWQQLRVEDLHALAARALHVLLEEVRFFYGDEDLIIDPGGTATIRHNKDALYLLMDGTFEAARFMSCMGAMHWERIDFLPVVELFQSLVPGTGSAVFELIRGLYDDQREAGADPLPLRYRGIPTYPSAGAFRLFSAFFAPTAPAGQDPLRVFMDPSRASEVLWRPAADAPRRYFDLLRRLCVTIKGETVQRVTQADDPTGLSYSASAPGRPAAGDCDGPSFSGPQAGSSGIRVSA